jgi:hypothetical protein
MKAKKIKSIKAWLVVNEKGGPLDVLFYKPDKHSYFNIGSWTYPVEGNTVIPVLITPIKS